MNGAVQGVAMITASTPVKKLCCAGSRPSAAGAENSNSPARFRVAAKISQAISATKIGDWNWNPQPTSAPSARKASSAPPSSSIAASTPAV